MFRGISEPEIKVPDSREAQHQIRSFSCARHSTRPREVHLAIMLDAGFANLIKEGQMAFVT
jgi:hypothetical protein